MTTSAEQFNIISFKNDLKKEFGKLKKELPSKKQVEKLQETMDFIVRDYQNFDAEKTSNLAAHNRLNEN